MTRESYLQEINAAKDGSDAWTLNADKMNIVIGDLHITVAHGPESTTWDMCDPNGYVLANGSSQTRELAKAEALLFAGHYARTMVDALHA